MSLSQKIVGVVIGIVVVGCSGLGYAKSLNATVHRSGSEFSLVVGQDSVPQLRKINIRNLGGRTIAPILRERDGVDYRDIGRFVTSMTKGRTTDLEKAHAIAQGIQRLSFASARLPATFDPLKISAGYGGGFCLHQSYEFQMLAQLAGLRVRTCGHQFGYTHVTNEIYVRRKWRVEDVSLDISSDHSFSEISRNPSYAVQGDAYGQMPSGTDSARYVDALYSGTTKCYEFKIAPTSRFSEMRVTLEHGDVLSFDFPTLNPADPGDFGIGVGSITRTLVMARHDLVARLSSPWPLSDVQISAPKASEPADFDVEISRNGVKDWLKMERVGAANEWTFRIEDPERWRPSVVQRKSTTTFKRYGDILRTLNNAPRFLFRWSDYTYFVRVSSHGAHRAPTQLEVRTGFTFNPAAMPQLKPGRNSLIYQDDGVKGPRDIQVSIQWDEQRKAPVQKLPGNYAIKLSEEMNVVSPPRLVAGVHDDAHLTFAAHSSTGNRIIYRHMENGRWSQPVYISPPGWNAGRPDLALNDGGNVIIVFEAIAQGLKGIYTSSIDNKDNPSLPQLVAARDDFQIPSVSHRDGTTVFAWEGLLTTALDKGRGGIEVSYIKIGEDGAPIEVRGHEYPNFGNPRVLFADKNRILVTGTKGPRYIASFARDGSSLGTDYLTTKNVMFNSRGGALTESNDGRICAAFDARVKNTSSRIYMRCSTHGHPGWDEIRMMSPDDGLNSIYPAIVMKDANSGLVAWMNEGKRTKTVTARYFGGGRPEIILLSDRQAKYPAVALGGGDWVVWNERSKNGATSVFGADLRGVWHTDSAGAGNTYLDK